jgi:hypothetical protein
MKAKKLKKFKKQVNSLLNDPNFIRLGELLEKQRQEKQKVKKKL